MRRTLLVGLDGGTFDVVDPLLARGELPHLAALIARGVRAQLRSTLPPLTASAWPTILTGLNPGQHGIFRFERLDHVSAATRHAPPVTSDGFAGRTLFDYVSREGGRVMGVTIPMCYPVWPVNGRLQAGYPTPAGLGANAYPPQWTAELDRQFPSTETFEGSPLAKGTDATRHLAEAERRLDRLGDYVAELLRTERPDFSMLVLSETDHFQHWYWSETRRVSMGDPIAGVYRAADRVIGKLVEAAAADCIVGVVSDHGGGPAPGRLFSVNAWLRDQGLLGAPRQASATFRRRALRLLRSTSRPALKSLLLPLLPTRTREGLREAEVTSKLPDWEATQAYFVRLAYPIGGINLNVRGREPHGTVEPGTAYQALRERLAADLHAVVDPASRARVVEHVWMREEVYRGPFAENAPDLIFQTSEAYFPAQGLYGDAFKVAPSDHPEAKRGQHRMDGMLVLAGAEVFKSATALDGAGVADVAPTLLCAMGIQVPEGLDGEVLTAAFDAQFTREVEPGTSAALPVLPRAASEYSADEEAGIRAALRGLGYVD